MKIRSVASSGLLFALLLPCACAGPRGSQLDVWEQKAIAEEAYVYAFPMIAAYKAMYQFNVDRASSQYKGPFNQIVNESHVATPKDTAIVTPNSDTPYSMLQLDLRAEPIVLCVPEVEKGRYFSVQLTDMYAFNYGYIGSRATGNAAGCYLVSGPNWKGEKPAGIEKVFASETQFGLVDLPHPALRPGRHRQREEDPGRLPGRAALRLPEAAGAARGSRAGLPEVRRERLQDRLHRVPELPAPVLSCRFRRRRRCASGSRRSGSRPARRYDFKSLPLEDRLGVGLGIKDGFESIAKQKAEIGSEANGWRVGSAFGDRAFYHGDYLLRAGAALAGIYGNDAVEALYPMTMADSKGRKLDGSKYRYTITFPARQYPPVNAFWSVTMYDGKTQLLVENPIDRYLINSPMLPKLRKNPDGSLTIYIQKESPGKTSESNWLPAPDGPIYLVMRLYWPKQLALAGEWKPAPVLRVE